MDISCISKESFSTLLHGSFFFEDLPERWMNMAPAKSLEELILLQEEHLAAET